jgi:hypothetical protein
MFEWRKKKVPIRGEVLFHGSSPLQSHEFEFLKDKGITITPVPARDFQRWALHLEHPKWGCATLACPKRSQPLSTLLIPLIDTITDNEKKQR